MNYNLNHNNYHAASINFRVVRDLPLAEAEYPATVELPKHSHRHAGFCLILKGGYTESYGKTVLELKLSGHPQGLISDKTFRMDKIAGAG